MASNSFGEIFRITTFGESHGPAIGVVIDGCPAGVQICREEIQEALFWRRPGRSLFTSPREEQDPVEILSGVFEGKTTGAPIALLIANLDAQSSAYTPLQSILRPGHADFAYLEKYKVFDFRGGGRASARETAARVAAGAIAQKVLLTHSIEIVSYLIQIGPFRTPKMPLPEDLTALKQLIRSDPLYCIDPQTSQEMQTLLKTTQEEGDSWGGIVETTVSPIPSGLGDPVYRKLEALLAFAMLSLPASKGFEIGSGFLCASLKGSEHNDPFILSPSGNVTTQTHHAGGVLGGISIGTPLTFRVAFKPPSSIAKTQETLSTHHKPLSFSRPPQARHDPCVAIRAVPVVEAMTALVLTDALLSQRSAQI